MVLTGEQVYRTMHSGEADKSCVRLLEAGVTREHGSGCREKAGRVIVTIQPGYSR